MKYETKLIWLLGITFGFLFFDRNAVNYLMPFIANDLHFNYKQVGLVISALSFSWAVSAFLGGLYSDHSGRRKPILLATTVAFSLCSFMSGMVATFIQLFLVRMLMGAVEGPFMPVASRSWRASRARSAAATTWACCRTSAATSSDRSRAAGAGRDRNGLQLARIVLHGRHTGAHHGGADLALRARTGCAAHGRRCRRCRRSRASKPAGPKMREMLAHRNMWLCMFMSIVMVAWMVLGWAFLPLYYEKVRHMPPGTNSTLMSVLGLSAAFFSFVVPRLSDRFGRRPVVVLFNVVGLLVPLVVLYYGGSVYALALLIFLGWSASGTFPLFMSTIPSESIPASFVATSVGMVVGLGEVLGGVSGPALAGWAADIYGLSAPLVIQGACAIVGMVLALFLVETAPVKVGSIAAATARAA